MLHAIKNTLTELKNRFKTMPVIYITILFLASVIFFNQDIPESFMPIILLSSKSFKNKKMGSYVSSIHLYISTALYFYKYIQLIGRTISSFTNVSIPILLNQFIFIFLKELYFRNES